MKNKLGIFCMSLGTVLIIAALSLFLHNQAEDTKAGSMASEVVCQLAQQIYSPTMDATPSHVPAGSVPETSLPDPFDPTMKTTEIDGYLYVGYVSIPSLELTLPVMSDWSYAQLRIAPCRYSGSTKTDDLVVMAHNYARHFGQLRDLSAGDQVLFTDMDGIVSNYVVVALDILSPTDVEDMTAGEYDLTLFTCTYGGKSRVTVRCDRTEDPLT